MISILKFRTSGTESLIEKIKAEINKRAEAKAKRMFLRRPKRLAKPQHLAKDKQRQTSYSSKFIC